MSKAQPRLDPLAEFVKRIQRFNALDGRDHFRSFIEMAYCSYAKVTAGNKERADKLEERYMQIVGTLKPETVREYPELVGLIFNGLLPGGCDFLGSAASQLEALNAHAGQFFTPYHISRCMAEMVLGDLGATLAAKGFVTIAEPACGSGGMILAAADVFKAKGFEPHTSMLARATDVSPLCFQMTFLQLTLRGIPALVQYGDSLGNEAPWEQAWTPAAIEFYERHGRLFDEAEQQPVEQQPLPMPPQQPGAPLQLSFFAS